jgi:hypothetical protein
MMYLRLYSSLTVYSDKLTLCHLAAYSVLRRFWHAVKNFSPANVRITTFLVEKSPTVHQSSPQFPNTGEIFGFDG